MNIEKIGVLCFFPFPKGMASTTRIVSYCKGIETYGIKTQVFSSVWVRDDSEIASNGYIEGVNYIIPHKWNTKKSKIHKVLVDKSLMYFKTIKLILKSHKEKPFNYLLIAFDQYDLHIKYAFILWLCGIKLAFITDEYPEPIRKLKPQIPTWMKYTFKLTHKFFKCRILMTNKIKEYYDNNIYPLPSHIMPSIIDTARFDGVEKKESGRRYMCYMGNFDLKKDNVDNIVKAFALIADRYPDIDLHLYGTPSATDKETIEKLIKQKSLEERVFIKGRIDYDQVPQTIMNATVLVTSQPQTKRAEGGFPTKMGEYMMTGNPTILTDVGEIHEYIQDGVNAYMVAPCDPESYAKKLAYILDNYDTALDVAKVGKKYILDHFKCENIAYNLVDFLNELK